MNFFAEIVQICERFDVRDGNTAASGFGGQFSAVAGRFSEKGLPDNSLVGDDPQFGGAVPCARML